ncbi:hypothetical protein ID0213_05440 [Helicobacter pylori]
MNHLLILYNPYYQQDVIQQHLSVLQEKSQVGFGKIRSKLNDQERQDSLEEIYKATNEKNFLQLFLTDYANLFAAKVIKVSKNIDEGLIPSYYKEKNLEVEDFFIISDLRELVREDFSLNIIHAELELLQSENDLLNDFTSIIVKYSKTLEYEIYLFAKKVLLKACARDPNLYDLTYEVQGKSYTLKDFFTKKPNPGSIKYLLRHERVQPHLEESLNRFINSSFQKSIGIIQEIRNEAVHKKAPSLHELEKLGNEILGTEGASLLKSILTRKETS